MPIRPPIPVPEDITPREFHGEILPRLVEAGEGLKVDPAMEGTIYVRQLRIKGPNGGIWTATIRDGKSFELTEGQADKPHVAATVDEKDWRDSVTGRIDTGIYTKTGLSFRITREDFDRITELKGRVVSILRKPDGDTVKSMAVFNGYESPDVKIIFDHKDYLAMTKGEIDGKALFLEGRMEIEGDIILAMRLGMIDMNSIFS